jgi:hypothetical protein
LPARCSPAPFVLSRFFFHYRERLRGLDMPLIDIGDASLSVYDEALVGPSTPIIPLFR